MVLRHSSWRDFKEGLDHVHHRAVDENVDPAKGVDRRLHHFAHRRRVGDVADMADRAAACRVDLANQRVEFGLRAARVDANRCACRGHFERERAADIARAARDDDDLAGKFPAVGHPAFSL